MRVRQTRAPTAPRRESFVPLRRRRRYPGERHGRWIVLLDVQVEGVIERRVRPASLLQVCSHALTTKHLPVFDLIDNGRTAAANRGADERTLLPADECADTRAGAGRASNDEQALLP